MKRKWIWLAVIAVVFIVGYIGVRAVLAAGGQQALSSLQTTEVKRGSLTASVGATGTIQARQYAVMTFSLTGRVQEVHVALGDRVNAEDVLVTLDPAYYPQQVIAAQADLINAQKALDDLKRSNTALAKAELEWANAKKALDDAEIEYDRATDAFYMGNLKEAQDRFDLKEARYTYWRMQKITNQTQQIQYQRAYLDYIHAWQDLQKAQADYDAGARGGTEKAQMDLDIAKGEYDVAKARFEDAQANYDRLAGGPPAEDIAAAQARVDSAQAVLNQTRITAPFAGTILSVGVIPGDMVGPGTVALAIGDLSELSVEVPIAEVDYHRLAIGQPAELVMDAIVDTVYHGTVVEIQLDASVTGGSVSYPVKIILGDADEFVLPGMTVAVDIEVSRLDDVLLVPNRAVRAVNGSRVVYILEGGTLEQVDVRLGSSNDTMSEVVGGELQEGDLVVLNPPSQFFSNAGPGSGAGFRMMQ